jgi:hypothetical protein
METQHVYIKYYLDEFHACGFSDRPWSHRFSRFPPVCKHILRWFSGRTLLQYSSPASTDPNSSDLALQATKFPFRIMQISFNQNVRIPWLLSPVVIKSYFTTTANNLLSIIQATDHCLGSEQDALNQYTRTSAWHIPRFLLFSSFFFS